MGRIGGPERDIFERYLRRLPTRPEVVELADGRGVPDEIRRREADAFRAALPAGAVTVCLDGDGAALDSEAFAAAVGRWKEGGRPVAFLVGGAEGLATSLLEGAAARLSLGPQTWPHMLARVMLAEQLYRAWSINAGHPYHRGGRAGPVSGRRGPPRRS